MVVVGCVWGGRWRRCVPAMHWGHMHGGHGGSWRDRVRTRRRLPTHGWVVCLGCMHISMCVRMRACACTSALDREAPPHAPTPSPPLTKTHSEATLLPEPPSLPPHPNPLNPKPTSSLCSPHALVAASTAAAAAAMVGAEGSQGKRAGLTAHCLPRRLVALPAHVVVLDHGHHLRAGGGGAGGGGAGWWWWWWWCRGRRGRWGGGGCGGGGGGGWGWGGGSMQHGTARHGPKGWGALLPPSQLPARPPASEPSARRHAPSCRAGMHARIHTRTHAHPPHPTPLA